MSVDQSLRLGGDLSAKAREDLVARIFVGLADTLVEGYDLVEFVHQLVEDSIALFAIEQGYAALADGDGRLRPLASSNNEAGSIQLIEMHHQEGPSIECWSTGLLVRESHLARAEMRWPTFRSAALTAGFNSVYAIPMRLRDERVGVLTLFASKTSGLAEADEDLAQSLADVASIGILHESFYRRTTRVYHQLEVAFETRIVIEQAKGVAAEVLKVSVDEAFALIRRYARDHNVLLSEVARRVIDQELESTDFLT